MERPGKIGLVGASCKTATSVNHVEVAEMIDPDRREAGAGTDIGREAPPRAEIDIAIDEPDPFGLAGRVVVGVDVGTIWTSRIDKIIERMETGLAAVLALSFVSQP